MFSMSQNSKTLKLQQVHRKLGTKEKLNINKSARTVERKTFNGLLLAVVLTTTALVAFVSGYFLSNSSDDTLDSRVSNGQAKTNNTSVAGTKRSHSHVSVEALQELTELDRFESMFARTVALNGFLDRADAASLQRYWDQVESFDSLSLRFEVQKGIVQRWVVIDPTTALTLITDELTRDRRNTLLEVFYREWSRVNLEESLRYVETLDKESQLFALTSILLEREDLTIERRRQLARRLDREWLAYAVVSDTVEKPELEWMRFVDHNRDRWDDLGDSQLQMLSHIAFAWVVQDGVEAFSKMRDALPPAFSLLETTEIVINKLINKDPQLAFDLVANRTKHETDTRYRQLAEEFVDQWSKTDPRAALATASDITVRGLRLRLQHRTVRTWAERDPFTIMGELETLPEHLRIYAREWALTTIAGASPQFVLKTLSDITDPIVRNDAIDTLVRGWARQDLASVLDWIHTTPDVAGVQTDLKLTAFYSLAESNPQLALESALTQPLEDGEVGMEGKVVAWISHVGQLDVAVSMLSQMRDASTTTYAYESVIRDLIDHEDASRAMDLLFELCKNESLNIKDPLNTVAHHAPDRLFAALDQMQRPILRAEAARLLHKYHKDTGRFTTAQIATLQGLIQSEHRSRLNSAYDELYEAMREQE